MGNPAVYYQYFLSSFVLKLSGEGEIDEPFFTKKDIPLFTNDETTKKLEDIITSCKNTVPKSIFYYLAGMSTVDTLKWASTKGCDDVNAALGGITEAEDFIELDEFKNREFDDKNKGYYVRPKFDIGTECYTIHRKPVHYKCPVCEGQGHFIHNNIVIDCNNCNRTGLVHNVHQTILEPCKVKITGVTASIRENGSEIKYKVTTDEKYVKAKNRQEQTLFATEEEAEEYCKLCNQKINTPTF